MIKKRELEIFLSKLEFYTTPKLLMEQYTTPPYLASNLLYMAAYTFNDIIGKTICDLGCGNGILALGSAFLGSRMAVGIDIDKASVQVAKVNREKTGLDIDLAVGDIGILKGRFDTVLENPPFGVRRKGEDIRFLAKALSIADTVYSIHKSGERNRSFIKSTVVNKLNGNITNIMETDLVISHVFNFHRKPKYRVKVDIYRIVKK